MEKASMMEKRFDHIWSVLKGTIWAMRPEKLEEVIGVLQLKAAGAELPFEAAESKGAERSRGIAVLPLAGIIGQKMNLMMKFSGGTSTELFTRDLRALAGDPEVAGIIIDTDSPGGGVFGVPEAAQEILALRKNKPIWAVANSETASAAYWIASAAEELIVTPSGEVGSIGVYALHSDFSAAETEAGIKNTFIKAGRFKTAGNPYEPLGDEARDYLQSGVDRYYDMFAAAVARHRNATVDEVKNGFGEGGMVGARDAIKMGMADRVATLDETIDRMLRVVNKRQSSATAMAAIPDEERRRRLQMA